VGPASPTMAQLGPGFVPVTEPPRGGVRRPGSA
jgi:hypothetical protein